ncbi:MAG TPA: EAL domain-containing protein [Hyphomonadaceae bacterium]|nr:EAL domain-containing protein [Hyphomonadaceae bacterium]HPN06102.1 EAL domain-containing protein [Hyphomonadaceae bacterium]
MKAAKVKSPKQTSERAITAGSAGESGARRPARRRFGLACRVAAIGLGAAIVATLAQWIATPIMAQNEIRLQQAIAVSSGVNLLTDVATLHAKAGHWDEIGELVDALSNGLPGGQSVVLDANWKRVASDGAADPLPALADLKVLAAEHNGILNMGNRVYAARPIGSDRVVGYAVFSFAPRPAINIWLAIVALNAIVLVLALTVLAPFLLPIARRALKPVTDLERAIRSRDPKDKSKLADQSEDRLLKPLLTAIDEVHERSEAAMRRALTMAYTDPVTRLPNRLRFVSKLDASVAGGQALSLVICDLDRFRQVNVTYGPRAADMALAGVAERLRATASQSSIASFFVGRIGADQFGILILDADQQTVADFLIAAEKAVAETMSIDDHHVRVTASFGVSRAPDDAQTSFDLLKLAEVALKEAKSGAGPRRAFFSQSLLSRAHAKLRLEEEIREGLERGEFVAVFQPKVKLETGELVGAEALARWRRPDGAIVSPGQFIPIAEELGVIHTLGKSVMRDACFAAAGWNRKGIISSIAVNISPHQFDDPDFVNSVYQALDDSGLPPELLELEITESAAVADADRVARIMWPLRNRGVRLAIDDFGTGHSNFSAITRLPFDVFKIDQQFVRALSTDPHAPAIVEMILAMAEALGQETVAEGVETKEQADFLLRRACTIGQGYYYSPPLPADEFDAFVRSYRPRPADRFAA